MSLAKTSILIIPQDSSPVKSPKFDTTSILHTQASSDDVTSFSESFSEKSLFSPKKDRYSLEGVALKLQILTRTGISASKISLLSGSCNGLSSFAQSVSMPCEDLRAQDSLLLLDKLPRQVIKSEVVENPKPKVRDEFRDKYIASLKTRNILDSDSKKKHQSFMLIDWDGALFGGADIEEVKSNQKFIKGDSLLKMLDETASKLLAKAAAHCPVIIVTSYDPKAVEYSLRLYLPLTYQIFEKHNMQIISLREDENENHNSQESERRVPKELMNLKKKFADDVGTNILCVVDSETKIHIIEKFTQKFDGAYVKFMRFKDSVKVAQLVKQQELLMKEFENIFFSLRSFTMQFAKTQGKK